MQLHFSVFKNKTDAKNGLIHRITVEECIEQFFSRHVLRENKDSANFNLGHYRESTVDYTGKERVHRLTDNIDGVYGIGFDIDNKDKSVPAFKILDATRLFADYTYVIYTSYSHLLDGDTHRFRIVLFFDKMLPKEYYRDVWEIFLAMFPDNRNVDPSCKDVARFWYLPACPTKMQHQSILKKQFKNLISVDEMIEKVDLARVTIMQQEPLTGLLEGIGKVSDQRKNHQTLARTDSNYIMSPHDVKGKDDSLSTNISFNNSSTISQKDSLHTTDGSDLQDRIVKVLDEPEMHVSNFTGNNYSEWIQIGSALKGEGMPFAIFDEWSSRDSSKYAEAGGSRGLYKRWSGFNGSCSAGTIFEIAKQKGAKHWLGHEPGSRPNLSIVRKESGHQEDSAQNSHRTAAVVRNPNDSVLTAEESVDYKPREKERLCTDFPIDLCDKAPENIRLFMDYVMTTTPVPHPVFALASSISVMGALYHQRIHAEYKRCCTNLYILSLALSGQGKGHALDCIKELFSQMRLDDMIGGIPASTAGLLTALHTKEGNLYLPIDEFDKSFLKMLHSKAVGQHMIGVSAEMMKLYSAPNRPYVAGQMYADAEKNKKPPILNPHLSMYGACTDTDFYKHYSGDSAEDGFLARIIPFANREFYPAHVRDYGDNKNIPEGLKRLVKRITSDKIRKIGSDLDMTLHTLAIPFDSKSTADFHADCTEFWRKIAHEGAKSGKTKTASLHNRICENALKIALCAHEGGVISRPIWEWALNVATMTTENVINNAVNPVGDNEFDSHTKRVERFIVDQAGWVSRSSLTLKMRMDTKKLTQLLDYLVESGKIVARAAKVDGSRKSTTEYLAI